MRVDLLDGKYTVIAEEGRLETLRYGESWRDLTGDKFVHALVDHIEDLQNEIQTLKQGQGAPIGKVVDCDLLGSPLIRWEGERPTIGDNLYLNAPASGDWIAAGDYYRNVKELDAALNGEGGALRPSLVDVLAQVEGEARRLGMPVLQVVQACRESVGIIKLLIKVAQAAHDAVDDSEEVADAYGTHHLIGGHDFDLLSAFLDALDNLPDDKPGYTLSGPGRAEWALRALLG